MYKLKKFLLNNNSKIFVCCPQVITGGPECLHQLTDQLRLNGHNAFICYYPFDKPFECPSAYRMYDAPQATIDDHRENILIIPETATYITRCISQAQVGIWWLSVDNYFDPQHRSRFRDFVRRYRSLLRGTRVALPFLRGYLHFTQSHYASDFLRRNFIHSMALTDYLGEEHLSEQAGMKTSERENIVVYNPKKGYNQTVALMNAYPKITFVPMFNMSRVDVIKLLYRAKVYIDFGHHPGKDKPPRESAIAGCCIITGKRGSAKYHEDVPIPSEYKLDDSQESYISECGSLINLIFQDYEFHIKKFSRYREKIISEPNLFKEQVNIIFPHPQLSAGDPIL